MNLFFWRKEKLPTKKQVKKEDKSFRKSAQKLKKLITKKR